VSKGPNLFKSDSSRSAWLRVAPVAGEARLQTRRKASFRMNCGGLRLSRSGRSGMFVLPRLCGPEGGKLRCPPQNDERREMVSP